MGTKPVASAAMCAACVAQGVTYVGGALAGLQVMAVRAKSRRRRAEESTAETAADAPATADESQHDGGSERQPEPAST
jgi:hypothetical protein